MEAHISKWHQSMLERYGSEEALSNHMRSLQAKSSGTKNKPETTGFVKMQREDPEKFKELQRERGRKGAKSRWAKKEEV